MFSFVWTLCLPDRKCSGTGCIISEKALFANVLVLYVLFTDVIHMINVEKPFMSQEFCITWSTVCSLWKPASKYFAAFLPSDKSLHVLALKRPLPSERFFFFDVGGRKPAADPISVTSKLKARVCLFEFQTLSWIAVWKRPLAFLPQWKGCPRTWKWVLEKVLLKNIYVQVITACGIWNTCNSAYKQHVVCLKDFSLFKKH